MDSSMAQMTLEAWGNQMLVEHRLELFPLKPMPDEEVAAMIRNLVLHPSDCYDSKALADTEPTGVTRKGSRGLCIEGNFEDRSLNVKSDG
ncbi:hypothetical protein [Shimazuella alba]|uniref:Uncharacterized protein n=1 Tax=Shimazuella alba TaxID=2690964 RepID=A0A6I4VQ15_9BACL|nr:hypothetical protein [Shimazuella alba]MXQ53737.1 hypothetical protein [Shimazuella alba]